MSQNYVSPIALLSRDASTSTIFFSAIAIYWLVFFATSYATSRYLSYPDIRREMASYIFDWNAYSNIASDDKDIRVDSLMGASSILSRSLDYYNTIGSGEDITDDDDDKHSFDGSATAEYTNEQVDPYRDFEDLMAEPNIKSISNKLNMILKPIEGNVELSELSQMTARRAEEGDNVSLHISAPGTSRKSRGAVDEVDNLMPSPAESLPNIFVNPTARRFSIFDLFNFRTTK